MDILDRHTFGALVADLRYPALSIAGRPVAGADAWPPVLAGATRQERARILRRLPLLVATDGGRARLAAWRAEEPLPAIPAGELEAWIRERVCFYGDEMLFPVVVGALRLAPEAVREAALHETAFVAVGVDSTAWTASATFTDREGQRKPRVIVLGPAANVVTVLHEIAHVWHAAPPGGEHVAIGAQGEAGLRAHAEADGWLPRMDSALAAGERLAAACALVWGLGAV